MSNFVEEVAFLIRTDACQFNFTHRNCTALVFYNEDCLVDILSLADKQHFIIHIDTSYDMSYYYVTSISFLNTKLIRKKTNKPPLFGGPVILHK